MSQTNHLQIVISDLQRTAGPYISAIFDRVRRFWGRDIVNKNCYCADQR